MLQQYGSTAERGDAGLSHLHPLHLWRLLWFCTDHCVEDHHRNTGRPWSLRGFEKLDFLAEGQGGQALEKGSL